MPLARDLRGLPFSLAIIGLIAVKIYGARVATWLRDNDQRLN